MRGSPLERSAAETSAGLSSALASAPKGHSQALCHTMSVAPQKRQALLQLYPHLCSVSPVTSPPVHATLAQYFSVAEYLDEFKMVVMGAVHGTTGVTPDTSARCTTLC